MLIQVSQEDIDKAYKTWHSPSHLRCQTCPVARAIKRTLNKAVFVFPESFSFEENGWGSRVSYELPRVATDFIHRFDTQKPVKPFQFEIEPIA